MDWTNGQPLDILLTSPHHVIHHVWSESVSKLVKKGASSVRSPFLAILQHAPFTSSSAGTPSQATSHPNSRWSPHTRCAYPTLCTLQPDDFYKCTCGLHVIFVVQTPQWLPMYFQLSPNTYHWFYGLSRSSTQTYLFSPQSVVIHLFSCSRHPGFSAPLSASLRNISEPSDQFILPMKHTIYNTSELSFKIPKYLRDLSQMTLFSPCKCVLSGT